MVPRPDGATAATDAAEGVHLLGRGDWLGVVQRASGGLQDRGRLSQVGLDVGGRSLRGAGEQSAVEELARGAGDLEDVGKDLAVPVAGLAVDGEEEKRRE